MDDKYASMSRAEKILFLIKQGLDEGEAELILEQEEVLENYYDCVSR